MFNWLRTLVLLVFSSLCVVNISAQQVQDALYIYRNDGKFHGFFFDDIERFAYSKVDTLGVEHDDYVVQEIYALDTVYRIPVSAIDSIAFVTPETQYKSDVTKADPAIANYITASDSLTWIRLSSGVPAAMLPKQGDKWLIEDGCTFIPEGFGGRVVSVAQDGSGITITTEALEPEEAFERAVFKAAFGSQDVSQARVRRKAPIFGSEEPIVIEPYVGTGSFGSSSGSKDLIDAFDLFTVTGSDGLGRIDFDIRPSVCARSFLSIDPLAGVHVDSYIDIDVDISLSSAVQGTLSSRFDVPFPTHYTFFKKEFKKKNGEEEEQPYAKVLWKAGMFVESSGKLDVDVTVSGHLNANASLKYLKRALIGDRWDADHDSNWNPHAFTINKLAGELSFTTGFFADASIEFTNPLTKGALGGGLRAELAPKWTADAISLTDISENLIDTYKKDEAYLKLDRDDLFWGYIYASLDISTKQFGFTHSIKKPTYNFVEAFVGGVPNIQVYHVFTDFEQSPYLVTAKYELQRNLMTPIKVGLAMFNKNEELVSTFWRPETYENQFSKTTVEHVFTIDPLKDEATRYTIFPMVSYFGSPILYYQNYYYDVEPAFAETPPDIELPGSEGEYDFAIRTNIPDFAFSLNANWVTARWKQDESTVILAHEELPEDMESRDCVLHIIGKNSKGDVLLERDIPVKQLKPSITFSPEVIEAAAEGGTYTTKIVKTTLTGIEVSPVDDYLHPTKEGDIITVVVDPNPDTRSRKGHVIVKGMTEGGQTMEVKLEVRQKAAEEEPGPGPGPDPDPEPGETIDVKELWFSPDVNTNVEKTVDNDPMSKLDYYWNEMQYNMFDGVSANEEEISNNTVSVLATLSDDKIHVECIVPSKLYYRNVTSPYSEIELVPSWVNTQRLTFDIVKTKIDDDWSKFTIANMFLTERGEYHDNSEEKGQKKYGTITIPGTEDLSVDIFSDDDSWSCDFPMEINQTIIGMKGGIHCSYTNLGVTGYSMQYDSWDSWDNWETGGTEKATLHADFTYKQSNWENLGFRIVFADVEKFDAWVKR